MIRLIKDVEERLRIQRFCISQRKMNVWERKSEYIATSVQTKAYGYVKNKEEELVIDNVQSERRGSE